MRRFGHDPVVYLKALQAMVKRPDKGAIGFTLDDLEWCERAWQEVAIAGLGDDAFVHERDRYKHLVLQLKSGMRERQEDGVMMMEPQDWPHPRTIARALSVIEHAQVTRVQ